MQRIMLIILFIIIIALGLALGYWYGNSLGYKIGYDSGYTQAQNDDKVALDKQATSNNIEIETNPLQNIQVNPFQ